MKPTPLRRHLSTWLSLRVTLAVMLALLALGVNFEMFLRQSFLDNTRARMQRVYQRLNSNLEKIESEQGKRLEFFAQDESLIASIDLINQYQVKTRYNYALFDEEKKSLAQKTLERVKFSLNSDMAIYDQNEELLAFARRQSGIYQLGYVTFASGQAQIMVRAESQRDFLPGQLPADSSIGIRHSAHGAAEIGSQQAITSYQRLGQQLVIKSHRQVVATAAGRRIGLVELASVLDDAYFAQMSKDLDVTLTHAFDNPLPTTVAALARHADADALYVTESAEHYLGVMQKNTLNGPVFFTVALDKQRENALINRQRMQLFLLLLAIGGAMLIFLRLTLRRSLAQPLNQLMLQIRQIRQGNYTELPPPASGDELEEIGERVNALAAALAQRVAELTTSEEHSKALANSLHEAQQISQLGNWTLDLSNGELQWSPEVFRLFEVSAADFKGSYEFFLNCIHPDDQARVHQAYSESLANRTDYRIEHRLRMADGRIKWVNERCRTEFDDAGRPLRSVGTVQDITERKLAELALAEAHSLLMTVIDTIPMRVFWKDRQLNYLGCNTAFAHDAGRPTTADVVGLDDFQMGWAAQAELYRADDRQIIDSGDKKLFYDEQQTTAQGQSIWLRTSKVPLNDQNGQVIGVLGVYEDISERKKSDELLRKLSQVAEQSPENVVITDLAARIEYVNAAFLRNTGYCREETIGQNPRLLSSGQTPASRIAAMWQKLSQGEVWSGDFINRRRDGTLYTEHAVISPLRDDSGAVTHYVSVQDDITEKIRLADELEQHRHGLEQLVAQRTAELNSARVQAEASNRSKSEFLANMSHEIRTPLNGVIGMVDILHQTELKPEQHRMLGTIHSSSLALLQILNDILDFSKIEAGKLAVENIPTHLREVVEGTAQLMVSLSNAKAINLGVFVSPELPTWFFCDPNRLRQVLLNLLGNAIKFSKPEPGYQSRVGLWVVPGTLANGEVSVVLRIIDNGIGMSEEVVAHLFTPFTQADAGTARKFGGTGLGLAISQRLVTLMHGHISVNSKAGQGSEFSVELPLIAAPAAYPPPALPSLAGLEVLIVLSEATDSYAKQVLSAYCAAAGAQVSYIEDLAATRTRLAQSQPAAGSCVVLISGPVAAADDTLTLPADIGVARLAPPGSHKVGSEIMVATRPMLYRDLVQGLALAAGRLSSPEQASRAEQRDSLPRRAAPSVAQALQTHHLVLMAEDNETNRDVMQEQLRLLGYACEVAQDGAAALQMWQNGQADHAERDTPGAAAGRYALLLTDCHMPHLDGFGLTRAIRQAEPDGCHLPIIAITANAMQGEAQRCHESGMDDYLAKPLRMNELAAMLDKWLPLSATGLPSLAGQLANTRRNDEAGGQRLQGAQTYDAPDAPIWNPATLTELIGNNPAKQQRLLEKFLQHAQQQVSAILAAATASDTDALTDVAHTLKSAARSVGALRLGELCQRLEMAGRVGDATRCRVQVASLAAELSATASTIKHHLDL